MADKRWKAVERRMARDVGTERIPVTSRGWRLWDRVPSTAAALYRGGCSADDIGRLLGFSKKVVLRALRAMGEEPRRRSQSIDGRIFKEPNNGCWLWLGAKDGKGYPLAYIDGKTRKVHRYIFERDTGVSIAKGKSLDHLCRVRHCVRPSHLEAVQNSENTQRGLMAKLNPASVREMRSLYQSGEISQAAIARKYGIHEETARRILNRKAWANV